MRVFLLIHDLFVHENRCHGIASNSPGQSLGSSVTTQYCHEIFGGPASGLG